MLGYKALSLHYTMNLEEAKTTAIQLMYYLKSFYNEDYLNIYKNVMERNLDISLSEYIK